MDSILYIERAENELQLANIILQLSKEPKLQQNVLAIRQPQTTLTYGSGSVYKASKNTNHYATSVYACSSTDALKEQV